MSDKNNLIFEDNKWDKSNKEYFNYIKKLDFYFSKKFQCKNILGEGEKVKMEYHMKFFLILEHILEQQIFLVYYIVMKFIKKF